MTDPVAEEIDRAIEGRTVAGEFLRCVAEHGARVALREMEGRRALQERDPAGLFGKFFTRR